MKTTVRTFRITALALAALIFSAPALAGPPLLCHPFDTAGQATLAWGGDGWNQARADFPMDTLVARTETLLSPDVPVIARMETLRRAAIYASRDGAVARTLAARLEARIAMAESVGQRRLALFDAGYFLETVEEIVRLQGYDMPGVGPVDVEALRGLLAQGDGSRRLDEALALAPDDAALRFAAALVASADGRQDDVTRHGALARDGAAGDRLLARNIALVSR